MRPLINSSASTRFLLSIVAGVIATLVISATGSVFLSLLVGWDVAAVLFASSVWLIIGQMNADNTQKYALKEDPTRTITDILIVLVALASLGTIGLVLSNAGNGHKLDELLSALISIVSVVISWVVVHTIFTLRYAHLYYTSPIGGVSFNDDQKPNYIDFAYLAFTIGMTFQVSDTAFSSRKFRKTALRHAIISYVFGTVIIATTINLIAGLGK